MQMEESAGLHDRVGLRKILITLGGVILLFFFQERPRLAPGAIALLGAAAALLWVRPDVEETLRHVEWPVLLFFTALFVATGGLQASGVLAQLAGRVAGLAQDNLLAASLLMLWLAAGISAVVDNIPFTIAMLPVIVQLGALGVDAVPLYWAPGTRRGVRRKRHTHWFNRQRDHRVAERKDAHANHDAHLASFRAAGHAGYVYGCDLDVRPVFRLDADPLTPGGTEAQ